MPHAKDLWFLRFPDGRIRRAAESAIRDLLAAGRLPVGTRLRHSLDEEWQPLERIPEFALITPAPTNNGTAHVTIASRLDGTRLHLSGVRSLVEELLAALDSTLCARKLQVAAVGGVLLGLLAVLILLDFTPFIIAPAVPWIVACAALMVWSWLAVVLSKMTYAEVSLLRPARWVDGVSGSLGMTLKLTLAQGIVAAVLLGTIAALRWLPGWLSEQGDLDTTPYFALAAQFVAAGGMILELLLWPLLLFLLPMPALYTIEQASFGGGLRNWLALVGRKPGQLLIAQMLTLGVGLVLAAPLALLALVLSRAEEPNLLVAVTLTRSALLGMIGGVFLAYLVVANVFVYLHVRYDQH